PFKGRAFYSDRNAEIARRMKARESVATIAEALCIGGGWASQLCRRVANRQNILWGSDLLKAKRSERDREVARRLVNGERPEEIAEALQLSNYVAKERCAKIGKAIIAYGEGSPQDSRFARPSGDPIEAEEVRRRLAAGETHRQIGEAMGRTSAWVSYVRARLGLKVRNYLHVSDSEHDEIISRVRAGERIADVAHALGISTTAVLDHSASVRPARSRGVRSSAKLKPSGMAVPRKAARPITKRHLLRIEEGLRSGISMRQLAKQLGFNHTTIQRASLGIRQGLTESGVTCGCGKPIGHPRLCAVIAKSSRTARKGEITDRHRRQMEDRFLAGHSAHEIGKAMGFAHGNVLIATKAYRQEMFELGVTCGCGKMLGHQYCCKFTLKRRKTWRGGGLTAIGKRRVRLSLLEGNHLPDIVRDLDVAELSVLQMRKALTPDERAQRKEAMRDREAKPANVVRTYEVAEDEYSALIDIVTPYLRDHADRYAKRLATRSKDDLLHDGILTLWRARHTFKRDFDERPIEERFRVWANRILYVVFVKAYWADGGGRMRQAPDYSRSGSANEKWDFLTDTIIDDTTEAMLDELDLGSHES
ncbi:hypothetical protein, partial [Novosphingobium sp. 18050]